ncbi:hypothetical protein EB241_21250 [Erwinia psidii]|uniref:Uncharacterized protein n=1 Tax=Erwinia psidii TaxID=69224 RepID=A0A3N6S5P1_9GAMM|nr:hypothetical protein EB241_21250 [Erwinia psidii]
MPRLWVGGFGEIPYLMKINQLLTFSGGGLNNARYTGSVETLGRMGGRFAWLVVCATFRGVLAGRR